MGIRFRNKVRCTENNIFVLISMCVLSEISWIAVFRTDYCQWRRKPVLRIWYDVFCMCFCMCINASQLKCKNRVWCSWTRCWHWMFRIFVNVRNLRLCFAKFIAILYCGWLFQEWWLWENSNSNMYSCNALLQVNTSIIRMLPASPEEREVFLLKLCPI